MMRRIPSGERGSTIGMLSAFVDLFVGVSSLAAGTVAHRFGYPAAFLMATAALAAAALAGRWVFRRGPEPPAGAAGEDVAELEPVCGD
jgi:hypothetical protein